MTREFIGQPAPPTPEAPPSPPMPPTQSKATLLDQFAMAVSQEQVNMVVSGLGASHLNEIAQHEHPSLSEPMAVAAWKIALLCRVRYMIAHHMMHVSNSFKVAE